MARKHILAAIGACLVLSLSAGFNVAKADNQKGKSCRMEQQCHWENFKKICVWVKVCR
jgi:hypothetical protein